MSAVKALTSSCCVCYGVSFVCIFMKTVFYIINNNNKTYINLCFCCLRIEDGGLHQQVMQKEYGELSEPANQNENDLLPLCHRKPNERCT